MKDFGKVFVTGADGFIGSHLTEALLEIGCEVTALCQYNSKGSFGWLDEAVSDSRWNSRLTCILGDIRDQRFLDVHMREHETIFHLASLIAIPYSYVAPESYVSTNVQGTLNVVNAALNSKVKRFIHTSTSEVYGTAQYVPICEDHPLQGQSPYSASKIGADKIVESYYKSFGLPAVTVRPFNTYGPRQSLRAIIPTIINQAIFGDGKIELGVTHPTRDFNFVSDTVAGFISVAREMDKVNYGETYNVGSGSEISIADLVALVGDTLGKQITIVQDDNRIRPTLSEVDRLLASNSKVSDMCGWTPKVTLDEGLKHVAEWMKTQKSKIGQYVI